MIDIIKFLLENTTDAERKNLKKQGINIKNGYCIGSCEVPDEAMQLEGVEYIKSKKRKYKKRDKKYWNKFK